ncbi:MAG TPA: hypothetical protein VFO01_18615 [Trebonia sp.]|nr:hypothetical protein [Trebonia sp.]
MVKSDHLPSPRDEYIDQFSYSFYLAGTAAADLVMEPVGAAIERLIITFTQVRAHPHGAAAVPWEGAGT